MAWLKWVVRDVNDFISDSDSLAKDKRKAVKYLPTFGRFAESQDRSNPFNIL